jgi:peroxiredoxin
MMVPTPLPHKGTPLRRPLGVAVAALAGVVALGLAVLLAAPRVAKPAGSAAGSSSRVALSVGRPAPAFVVPGISGGEVALARYAGHPRVVTFFATECGACVGDLAALEPLYRRYKGAGLVVLGVGIEDTASTLSRAASRLGVSFPLGYDENGDRVAVPYGLTMIPTTVFIDREGIVRSVVEGSLRGDALRHQLALILQEGAQ